MSALSLSRRALLAAPLPLAALSRLARHRRRAKPSLCPALATCILLCLRPQRQLAATLARWVRLTPHDKQ
eukprot:12120745-Alexandrium_andersonii.AAC.1